MLLLILEEIGICPITFQDQCFTKLCRRYTIETAHKALSELYGRCAFSSAYLIRPKLERWLLERARIHKLHTQIFSA